MATCCLCSGVITGPDDERRIVYLSTVSAWSLGVPPATGDFQTHFQVLANNAAQTLVNFANQAVQIR